MVKRYQDENSLAEISRTGRSKVTTACNDRAIVKMSMSKRFETAAAMTRKFIKKWEKTICRNTVSRQLSEKNESKSSSKQASKF